MLSILIFVFIIITPFFVYRSAKQSGRNAILWALLTLAAGIGLQIIVPILFGIIYAVILTVSGSSAREVQESIQSIGSIVGIFCLFISIISIFLIMRHVGKIPDEKPFISPPTPPTFN
jgi:hypothetical protein